MSVWDEKRKGVWGEEEKEREKEGKVLHQTLNFIVAVRRAVSTAGGRRFCRGSGGGRWRCRSRR